ncbi:MAG: DUF4369 domain-containing protein [Tannerellaceae bacterium]|nr:DUF4369 domain-containing protein [Tannerellaceae bacterium]
MNPKTNVGIVAICCLLLSGCIPGCSRQHSVVIEGRLPDARYDGEPVYLVPLKNATARNVDSTRIRKDVFRFERIPGRKEEKENVYIIRTRPLLRLRLQELLIVAEPGCLHVTLDTISSARGTALNDALQQWKENKHRYDAIQRYVQAGLHAADALQKDSLLTYKEETDRAYAHDTYRFLVQNKGNAAGRLVYTLSRHVLTPRQRQTLQMPDE